MSAAISHVDSQIRQEEERLQRLQTLLSDDFVSKREVGINISRTKKAIKELKAKRDKITKWETK